MHVGLVGKAPQQLDKSSLFLGRVEGEELLELVDHEQRLIVTVAPPRNETEGDLEITDIHQFGDGFGVIFESGRKGASQ